MPRPSAGVALRGVALAAACSTRRCAALFFEHAAKPAEPPIKPLCFFALADWGGEQLPPYTTPGQLAVASTMGTVAALPGSHPAFVLAAGDNFYMMGLPGARVSGAWRARAGGRTEQSAPMPSQLRCPTRRRRCECAPRFRTCTPRRASRCRGTWWRATTTGLATSPVRAHFAALRCPHSGAQEERRKRR